jgi:hypothetical protein
MMQATRFCTDKYLYYALFKQRTNAGTRYGIPCALSSLAPSFPAPSEVSSFDCDFYLAEAASFDGRYEARPFKPNYPQGSQSHSAMKSSVPESRTQGLLTAQVRDGCHSLDHEGLGLGVRHERAVTREEAQRLFRVEQELHKREKLRNPVPIATIFAVRMPHATDCPNATKGRVLRSAMCAS